MQLAQRMSVLGTETAFEVLAKARELEAQGEHIIHLEIGEPDFNTPSNIIEAAIKALKEGYTHYGPSPGLMELRELIAQDVSVRKKIKVKAQNIVVTPGGKPIIFFSILALVAQGDEVIYPNPGFPIYESVINFSGACGVPIRLREENQFRLDVNELKKLITPKTKMIIINSPHNPTGSVMTYDDFKGIADLVANKDIYILTDEIYSRIIYDGEHISIASFPGMSERTIILDGFSKSYAMTGWRIGYGIMNESLAVQQARLMTNSNSCTATFTQRAAMEAVRGSQKPVEEMVSEFKKRRDVTVKGLNSIPKISCLLPQGAFYAYPNVTKLGWESKKLADFIMNEAKVAVLAGTSFGDFGQGYLRISYANSVQNIQEGLGRIKRALERV